MNEQPQEWVGQLGAFIFIVMVVFQTIKAYQNNVQISDNFTIGYIYEPVPISTAKPIKTKLVKLKPSTRVVENSFKNTQLYIDSVDALVALGMKKTQAKQRATEVFNNNKFNTIQEFLTIALSTT